MAASGKHCAGCRGYTAGFINECPGIPALIAAPGVEVMQTYIPRLIWRDRLRALIGKPVLLKTAVTSYGAGGGGMTA